VASLVVLWTVVCQVCHGAEDPNIPRPVAEIERLLLQDDFSIEHSQDNRFEGDRTQRVLLRLSDGERMKVKWAEFARGGEVFNNSPRYEIACYELQKLFLDEAEFVVPPTVARAFDLDWYRTTYPDAQPTFKDYLSVLVTLQFWLFNVANFDGWDEDRFRVDPIYAKNVGNFNVFTYLARHSDSNTGNFKIALAMYPPRIFAVDNGISIGEAQSDQGSQWRNLVVDRLPVATVERLRRIRGADIEAALGVVAQFEVRGRRLVTVTPTKPLNLKKGTRVRDDVIQIGLTSWEMKGIETRLKRLLEHVDKGRITTFRPQPSNRP